MATIKGLHPAYFITNQNTDNYNLWAKFLEYADGQKANRTLWFFIVLMAHGVLILPLPAVLMYYFNAPVWVLGITMAAFFGNLIANMAGGTIRTTLTLFAASVLAHVTLLLIFII